MSKASVGKLASGRKVYLDICILYAGAQPKLCRQHRSLTTSSAVTVSREGRFGGTSIANGCRCQQCQQYYEHCIIVFTCTEPYADVITSNQANNVTDNIFQKIGVNLHQCVLHLLMCLLLIKLNACKPAQHQATQNTLLQTALHWEIGNGLLSLWYQ